MPIGGGVGLVVKIIGDASGLSKSLGDAGGDVTSFGASALGTAAKVSVVAGAAVAAGAAIYGMGKAAADDRAEQEKLAAAIKAAGAETASSTAQVEAAIAAGQERAFTDSETREGLQSLVTATGDVSKATSLLSSAQDIARLAGVDLATATDAVAKAEAGNDKALRSLVPGMQKGTTAAQSIANATKLAAGQADIYARSAEGMEAKTTDAFGELTEEIGAVFLPVLDEVLPALIPILKAFGELVKSILPILIPLISTLAKIISVIAGVMVRWLGVIKSIVDWVYRLLRPLGDMLNKLKAINPFRGMSFPSFNASSTYAAAGAQTRAGGSGGYAGPVTINIHGDPSVIEAKVIRALRGYQARNGVGSVFKPGRT